MHSPPARTQEVVIPVVEEELVGIERRVVDTGHTLRVRKSVHEEVVDLDQPLIREYATAERVPVGRVIDEPAPVRHEGDVTIVPVMEERLVVRRELVLVEEVHITRRRETRIPDKEITLRRERVTVERFDPQRNAWQAADGDASDSPEPGAAPDQRS